VSLYLPNDDLTDIQIVRPSGYGYAQGFYDRKSRRKKNPFGFTELETKRKPKPKPKKKDKK
jgi:hypothetical protein